MSKRDVEILAQKLHQGWLNAMQRSGYHLPCDCPSLDGSCPKCCPDLVDYHNLPSEIRKKRLNHATSLTLDLVCGWS